MVTSKLLYMADWKPGVSFFVVVEINPRVGSYSNPDLCLVIFAHCNNLYFYYKAAVGYSLHVSGDTDQWNRIESSDINPHILIN